MGLTLTQRVVKAHYELPEDEFVATVETYDGVRAVLLVGASVSMPLGTGEQSPTITLSVGDGADARLFGGDWSARRETYDLAREALALTVRANRGSREGLPLRSQRMLALGWDAWRAEQDAQPVEPFTAAVKELAATANVVATPTDFPDVSTHIPDDADAMVAVS